MLASQLQLHHFSAALLHQTHRYPPPSLTTTTTVTPKFPNLFPISCSAHHPPETLQNQDTTTTLRNEDNILRTHNAQSTALLLRHLSPDEQQNPHSPPPENPKTNQQLHREAKEKQLEISLVNKRTPLFPGSIYANYPLPSVQSPSKRDKTDLQYDDDDGMLMKALEIRRKVTLDIFKDSMRKGKFGITYINNLASELSDFIDYVMIQAASMKQLPEFSMSSYNVRVEAVIDDSNVVPLIRWLKHNSLSYPQIGKLVSSCRGNFDAIRQLGEWLKGIHVKGRFIGVALTRARGNILERGLEELDEIVEYLEENGLRRDWMGYVIGRCPEILAFDMEEVKFRTEFYLNMGMSRNDFGTMLFDCPKVFGYLSVEEMSQKVAYLKEFGLNNEEVGRLVAFKPQLMICSIEDRWKPLVKYFYYLRISKDGMKRILITKPMTFCVDLEETIVPKVQFLRDIGVQEDAIGGILAKFPSLLSYSLYKKIRPVVIFLLTKAGVTQKDIGKVIALAPELLGCSIVHKLDHNVKYFLSLGIPLHVLGRMVADFPMLLRYNIDVLRPKYRYLRRVMVRPLQDLTEFPRLTSYSHDGGAILINERCHPPCEGMSTSMSNRKFFSYSLEERIIPRHKITVENRVNFKLRYMLASTDEEFNARVNAAVERRRRFEAGIGYERPLDTQNDEAKKAMLCDSMNP